MFFSQNNLRGECFYPRICDVTKHSFILEFGASPELACQVKSLNGSGSLGLRVDKISLYTGWRRQYIWTDIVHTYYSPSMKMQYLHRSTFLSSKMLQNLLYL